MTDKELEALIHKVEAATLGDVAMVEKQFAENDIQLPSRICDPYAIFDKLGNDGVEQENP